METVVLDRGIKVFYVTATSFPEGVTDAHAQLHQLVPFSADRNYFGISRPENNGPIVYRAATEEKNPGEAEQYRCDTLILKQGKYISITLHDFRKDPRSIESAFQALLNTKGLDPEGYCVEWYANDKEEVKCMIRMKDEYKKPKKSKTMANSTPYKNDHSDVNGLKMYYELHGNTGDYLVLIHGGGSTIGTSFGKVLPMLAKNCQVIAVELQGHGHTSDRNAPESFEQDADDVVTLLHNLHIAKASFLGFSNGGNTAIQIAVRHPEIVNKLVLASTFYKREGLPPGFFEGMKQATLQDMPRVLGDAFLAINPDRGKLLSMFNKDRERMLHFKDWKDETISSIKAPALIISGDRDVILPGHAVAMSKLIADSRLMILPSAHGGYMGAAESPEVGTHVIKMTVEVIKDFLNR